MLLWDHEGALKIGGQGMKTLIKNAWIIDGTGQERYKGCILIENGHIQKIIKEDAEGEALVKPASIVETHVDKVIEANGLICAPGFIDTHSHSDLKVLSEPELLPKLMQGITTEVLGQDGISMAPLPEKYIGPWKKNLAGLEGEDESINWHYESVSRYLKQIEEAKPSINEMYLLPHGNVRMAAMGLDNRKPTEEELTKMCDIVEKEMQKGCVGLSDGLIYMPCAYAHTEEIIALCKMVHRYDGIYVVHQRSEADDILESMDEMLTVARQSGVHLHFSHFKVCGKPNWHKLEGMLKKLDEAQKEGLSISFDQYPYIAGSTMLGVILPPWAHDGGTEKLMERLKEDTLREKMKEDMKNGIPGWDNFIQFAGVEGIFITSVVSEKNKEVIGLSLKELGEKRGKDPLDATFDLLLEEKNAVGMVDFYGTEEHVKRIMARPEMNLCTDGLLSGKPHPRVYGAFPRMLGKYVREEKCFPLETAIYKMTAKPAQVFQIKQRGQIKEGFFADLVLFDEEEVIDRGTFENPMQYPSGIDYVFVNGSLEIENGKFTGNRAGEVLKIERG